MMEKYAMSQKEQENLLIKHYRNLHSLSIRQLTAIQENDSPVITEFIEQKQIIIDQIKEWNEDFDASLCTADTATQLKQLLSEIILHEEEGQKILADRQANVRKQLVTNQKAKIIEQAYGNSLYTPVPRAIKR